eukprot:15452895-Alexandrium_andersonii.AAC.1
MLQSTSFHNPPCGNIKIAAIARSLKGAGPGTASTSIPKVPRAKLWAIVRADSGSADERGG